MVRLVPVEGRFSQRATWLVAFGRFFRSPLPQLHVALSLSGEHHADTVLPWLTQIFPPSRGPVLGKPRGESGSSAVRPLELENADGVYQLLALDHRDA
jgi:hypothetical protein